MNPLRDAMEGNPWSEEKLADWEFDQAEEDYYESLSDVALEELDTESEQAMEED